MQIPQETLSRLRQLGQEHVLLFWPELDSRQRQELLRQIDEIDWALVQRLVRQRNEGEHGESGADRAARANAPSQLVRLPRTAEDRSRDKQAAEKGNQLLREGKVGVILVAGGQGTRLGFDDPKGMFPIGPVSDRTLFQVLCEQVLARARRAGVTIPYFVMTSEATHEPTVQFFRKKKFFGLGEGQVHFFQQASLPAVEAESPRVLLEAKGRIATSPDGHGGLLGALRRHGLVDVMRQRGIEHLYYHQVDNPTAIVCDPVLLGHHADSGSDMTTKVVAKVSPEEKMGVLADVDGQTQIIEYSDLPGEQARRQQADGTLVFWAGNTGIHVFRRDFIERLTAGDISLGFHIAHKKVPCIDSKGQSIDPAAPNAHKFEQFIFDALPRADRALVVEADRSREFNPVKNAEGSDSPATCRAALSAIAKDWLTRAGCTIARGVTVEISPLIALDEEELASRLPQGCRFETDAVLSSPQDIPSGTR